ncbi:hypothetical protein SAMN05421863_10752 [Nitrosomonas communis]|uniref:Uncharacterized protein n=1 Tax=Nitrosomonas communis TaxID=44574 RepID=A0A1I4V298_9PROT|nr:hypothetical protein SAMN05421863_10752 [Nitrosomonas communis]
MTPPIRRTHGGRSHSCRQLAYTLASTLLSEAAGRVPYKNPEVFF